MRINKKILFSLMISILLIISIIMYRSFKINNKKVILVGKLVSIHLDYVKEDNNTNANNYKSVSSSEIGVLSYIDLENNSLFALGHNLSNNGDFSGLVYNANLYDIDKSTFENVGKFKAKADLNSEIGMVTNISNIGVFGNINNSEKILDSNLEVYIQNRFNIDKNEKAYIYLNIDKIEKNYFEVEINNIDFLSENQNIIIKLIDEDLIDIAGGIVGGMSGSPIIQNGKLIGILNYANEGDPRVGTAIFADKLF